MVLAAELLFSPCDILQVTIMFFRVERRIYGWSRLSRQEAFETPLTLHGTTFAPRKVGWRREQWRCMRLTLWNRRKGALSSRWKRTQSFI
jgi:hypothetical protein